MKLNSLGIVEILSLRNWLEVTYTSGRGYITLSKKHLEKLKSRLVEVDQELLRRALENDY